MKIPASSIAHLRPRDAFRHAGTSFAKGLVRHGPVTLLPAYVNHTPPFFEL
jgi:hypothetical protein